MRKEGPSALFYAAFAPLVSKGIPGRIGLGQRRLTAALLHGTAVTGMDDRQVRVPQPVRQIRMLFFHWITPGLV